MRFAVLKHRTPDTSPDSASTGGQSTDADRGARVPHVEAATVTCGSRRLSPRAVTHRYSHALTQFAGAFLVVCVTRNPSTTTSAHPPKPLLKMGAFRLRMEQQPPLRPQVGLATR